jgi:hypothetical protein
MAIKGCCKLGYRAEQIHSMARRMSELLCYLPCTTARSRSKSWSAGTSLNWAAQALQYAADVRRSTGRVSTRPPSDPDKASRLTEQRAFGFCQSLTVGIQAGAEAQLKNDQSNSNRLVLQKGKAERSRHSAGPLLPRAFEMQQRSNCASGNQPSPHAVFLQNLDCVSAVCARRSIGH